MSQTSNSSTKPDASMQDMLRMMDVASALRRERESAEAQLDLASHKASLRERLMATAAASGERLTTAEVDAAIEQYFAQQHCYQEPPAGWAKFWATVWVLRAQLLAILVVLTVLVVGSWLLVYALTQPTGSQVLPPASPATSPITGTAPSAASSSATPAEVVVVPARATQPSSASPDDAAAAELKSRYEAFEQLLAVARAMAADQNAQRRVAAIATKGQLAHVRKDAAAVRGAQSELDDLVARLQEVYTVRIVSRPGQRSGVFRIDQATGNVAGYYLIVEALPERGRALLRTIEDGETGRSQRVRIWGEQVPKSVYDRIVADKQADGVIDENVFARKELGYYEERVALDDGSGSAAIKRGRRITKWDN